jgi:plasmid replication initiation protein
VENIADIVARMAQNANRRRKPGSVSARAMETVKPRALLPDRHPTRDFFIADILDWALKDDRHSMEHPMFSLSKKPDHRMRRYEHNGHVITIKPGHDGMATIWDKDILIYAVSQLVEGINQGRKDVGPILRVTAYDLLVTTNRYSGGKNYEQLADALRRLSGTRIETDIKTNGIRQREGFGLLDSWKIIERSPSNGRMVAIQLRLSDWLYNAVLAGEVLTLNRNYFRLPGGLERRLYELARKHCGHQTKWTISLNLLHKKSGSSSTSKEFRRIVKKIAEGDCLPDYRMYYEETSDNVLFYTKDAEKLAASFAKISFKAQGTETHESQSRLTTNSSV